MRRPTTGQAPHGGTVRCVGWVGQYDTGLLPLLSPDTQCVGSLWSCCSDTVAELSGVLVVCVWWGESAFPCGQQYIVRMTGSRMVPQPPVGTNVKAKAAAEMVRIRNAQRDEERQVRAGRKEALRREREVERARLEELNVDLRQEREDARYRRLEAKERIALLARKERFEKQRRRTKLQQMATAHEVDVQTRTEQLLAKRRGEAERAAQNIARQEAESDLRAQLAAERSEVDMRWSDSLHSEQVSVARQRALDAATAAAKAKREWDQLLTTRRTAAAEEKRQTRVEIQAHREQEQRDQEETNRLAYEKLRADNELKRVTAEEDKARIATERRERRDEARKAAAERKGNLAKDVQWAASERQIEKDAKTKQRAVIQKHFHEDRQRRIFGEKLQTARMQLFTQKLHQHEKTQAFENGLRKKEERFGQPTAVPRHTDTDAPAMQHSAPMSGSEIQQEASALSFGGWSHDSGLELTEADGDEQQPAPLPELPKSASAICNQSESLTEAQSTAGSADTLQPESSRASALSQTSLDSKSMRSQASRWLASNPNLNPPAVTITPRQRKLAEETKSDRGKRLDANREEASAIVAIQAELLRYKSNSEWKGWKAPRPVSPTSGSATHNLSPGVNAEPKADRELSVSESPLGTADMSRASPKGSTAEAESSVDTDLADNNPGQANTDPEKATHPNQAESVLEAEAPGEPVPETTSVPGPTTEAHQSAVSRMVSLEQGIEYQLQPPVLKLPVATLNEPPEPSFAVHLGAGLFTTDAEIGPSNALVPQLSEEELHLQQPVGPKSYTSANPRSVAAAIATERSAILQTRSTSGLTQPPRRTLRPVVAGGLTPRSAARLNLIASPSTPKNDAMHAARIVLAKEWRRASSRGKDDGVAQPHLQPLPRPKQSSAGLPNSSGWHGGCGDWLNSTGNVVRKPAFDPGLQPPDAERPVQSAYLPVLANTWPKPPPKPRVEAAKLLRRVHAHTARAQYGQTLLDSVAGDQIAARISISTLPVTAR